MATSRQDPEVDALGHLEERVQKAVALVTRLRQEKEAALKEVAETQEQLMESQIANEQLTKEVQEFRAERQQVRGRIEKLLGHIDQLGAA
jgi:FtsZ-binding cell division protein ZapB